MLSCRIISPPPARPRTDDGHESGNLILSCALPRNDKQTRELFSKAFGRGRDPRCANCMAHCGYEPTAVIATMGSLRESLRAAVGG
jgi:hypothetical protein